MLLKATQCCCAAASVTSVSAEKKGAFSFEAPREEKSGAKTLRKFVLLLF